MNQKTVVISGYYGFDNLGDEAVLFSMLQALREQMPGLKCVVLSQNPAATAAEYGVVAVNRWHWRQVTGALRNADLLISGGGSLLQDVTGLKSLLYYLGIIWLARLYRRPVIYYAQGIGPVRTGLGKRLVAATTGGAWGVTVRDEESLQDLRHMGMKKPIAVTADPVLGLHPQSIDWAVGAQILKRYHVAPDSPVLGVAVRPWPTATNWVDELARALDMHAQAGRVVVLLPMQNPADVTVSRVVADKMQQTSVIIDEKLTVAQMLSVVGNCQVLVGMRLHALIFAAVCGVPPVGIVYDPKVERFLKRIQITPAATPEKLQAAALARQIEYFFNHHQQIQQTMAPQVKQLRQAAKISAQMVQNCLAAKTS